MIFAHQIVGLMPLIDSHFSWFWFLGAVILDIDHLFVLYKHKIFSLTKIFEIEAHEDKYNIRFKTKYGHSIFGAVVCSLPILFINAYGAMTFFFAYILHLILDWPDKDEKQYFYPFKFKVRGFLSILSKWEILFTLALLVVYIKMVI